MNVQFLAIAKNAKGVLIALLLISSVATATPYLVVRMEAGDKWEGVTPSLSYDALRYFARANDVLRGNFYPHDPYFIEHRDTPSPTPSLNDALVALPQFFGLSFNAAYYLDIFLWCITFLFLALSVLREFAIARPIALLGASWVYLGVYGDMLRPGAMQIVFPFFLLFLYFFRKHATGGRKSDILLAIVAGLSAHVYIYLFMTIFATMGLGALHTVLRKEWNEAKRMLTALFIGAIIAVPHFLNVFVLSHHEFYKETMVRIVFLSSHWPQIEAYYYGRWVVLGLLIVYVFRRLFPAYLSKDSAEFFLLTGGGILVSMWSNVVTGKDFDIAVHVGRFGIVWYLLLGITVLPPLVLLWKKEGERLIRVLCITVLFGLLVLQMFLNIPRAMAVFSFDKREVIEVQEYRGVIDWLKQQPESVVLAPEQLMMYLPTLAKQYILYSAHGSLFLLSDRELRERYMLYHAFDRLTVEQFLESPREYGGPTASRLAAVSVMRHNICELLSSDQACAPAKSEEDFLDVDALRAEYNAYYPELTSHIVREYAKYRVRYIVQKNGASLPPVLIEACPTVYQDPYYSVCIFEGSR